MLSVTLPLKGTGNQGTFSDSLFLFTVTRTGNEKDELSCLLWGRRRDYGKKPGGIACA